LVGSQHFPVVRSHHTPGRSWLVLGARKLGVVLALLCAESSLSTPSKKNGGRPVPGRPSSLSALKGSETGFAVSEPLMFNTNSASLVNGHPQHSSISCVVSKT